MELVYLPAGLPREESASVGGRPGRVPVEACIGLSGGIKLIKSPVKLTQKINKSKSSLGWKSWMGHDPKDRSEGQKQDDWKQSQLRNSPRECWDSALVTSCAQVGEPSWMGPLF